MPLSFQQHTANGSTTVFDASQIDGYLSTGHIYVFVNDVQKTAGVHYNLQTSPSLQVTFTAGNTPAFKDEVRIQRITPNTVADREVDFADGSVLNANDLDKSALQLLFITQEAEDTGSGALGKSFDQLSWNAEDLPIVASAMGTTPTSLATKGYVDNLALYGGAATLPQAWTFSGTGSQDLFTLIPVALSTDTNLFIVEVGGTILRPDVDYTFPTISQIQFTAPPALGTSNIRVRNFGVSRNINESVSTAMLQNDAVTTPKILNANVTAAKLATDSVETAKIVNLAVTTGKINDLAVTTGKLDNLAVTAGKIAAGAVTSAKLDTNISVAGTLGVTGAFTASGGLGGSLLNGIFVPAVTSPASTEITLAGIPAWAHRVTVVFSAISTTGSANESSFLIRVGNGSLVSTGYVSQGFLLQAATGLASGNRTDGFVTGPEPGQSGLNLYYGQFVLVKDFANSRWIGTGQLQRSGGAVQILLFSGHVNIGVIDRVGIRTVTNLVTFDSGEFGLYWE